MNINSQIKKIVVSAPLLYMFGEICEPAILGYFLSVFFCLVFLFKYSEESIWQCCIGLNFPVWMLVSALNHRLIINGIKLNLNDDYFNGKKQLKWKSLK